MRPERSIRVVDTSSVVGSSVSSRLRAGSTASGTVVVSVRVPSASGMSAPINRSCTWLGRDVT